MKRIKLALIGLFVISLSGCVKDYKVNEQQSEAVAEYMAGLLLSVDKNYDQGLEPIKNIEEDEASTPSPTTSPSSTDKGSVDSKETEDQYNYSLTEVIGVKDFEIQYDSYKLSETYKEDIENAYFSLDPRPGYQFLVTTFEVKNLTDETKRLNISKEKILYQLDVNVGTIYKPQFILLENDLKYLDIKVKADETKTALLVFEVLKETDITSANLIVSKDNKAETIKIK